MIGPLDVEHWAADGALTLFFFVAGLELKREFVGRVAAQAGGRGRAGRRRGLRGRRTGGDLPGRQRRPPDGDLDGWAIPAATDIAFALAVLAVVGSNLPTALRAFLLTLAVVDDLIVIMIIAIFFTSTLHLAGPGSGRSSRSRPGRVLQRLRVRTPLVYVPLAVAAWWFVHESGIHATIAGVVLGLLTRVRPDEGERAAPPSGSSTCCHRCRRRRRAVLRADVGRGRGQRRAATWLQDPVVIGVVLGAGGRQADRRARRAPGWSPGSRAPSSTSDVSWRDVVGVAVLAGIGFTVSLLVADLSFAGAERDAAKTAVLAGSLVSAVLGALMLGHRDRFHFTP